MVRGIPEPLSPLLSLCEGDLLGGRYRIEGLVRAKSAGVHLQATDLSSGARVSAHVLLAPDEEATRTWFLAGAERAKALKGPHVARVLDAGVTFEGHPWIVREHLASTTLAQYLRSGGTVSPSDAIDITLAVCDAIAEAHEHGIVHGSFGAHAVHVAWSATGLVDVKVAGAGTAAAERALTLGANKDAECILSAPEQMQRGSCVDGRSDVWAIGVLLHTLLSGKPPFSADTPSGASLSVVIDDPPRLEGVPAELAALTLAALARDPEKRTQSVLDLAETVVCFASHPDFHHERIAARRATRAAMRVEVNATVEMTERPRLDLVAQALDDLDHDPAPSVREIPIQARPKLSKLSSADETVLVPRHRKSDGSKVARGIGFFAIAASVALLVLAGTEGNRAKTLMSKVHLTNAAAVAPPPAAAPLPPPPVAVVQASAEPPPPPVLILPPPEKTATPPAPPAKRKRHH